jgi:argininosuccinate lyase
MPQKRNPDAAELTRGKAGRVFGRLLGLLATLKALPLTYNRDLQEDKEAVFDVVDTLSLCLSVCREMLHTAAFSAETMSRALSQGFPTATEVADYLVRKGMPFRQAHAVAGQIVQYCEKQGGGFEELTLEEWRSFSPEFDEDIVEIISPEGAMRARTSPGGTAPERVKEQIEQARKLLAPAAAP